MERITCNDVTESLMKVAEKANDIEEMIVLYQTSGSYGFYDTPGVTIEKAVFMLESLKQYLINCIQSGKK